MKKILYIILIITSISCYDHPLRVRKALKYSGENRKELEKALKHYKANPADSLKYKAACFLIENMIGKYSYYERYWDKNGKEIPVHAISSMTLEETIKKRDSISIITSWIEKVIQPDMEYITADFLIANIEAAFES